MWIILLILKKIFEIKKYIYYNIHYIAGKKLVTQIETLNFWRYFIKVSTKAFEVTILLDKWRAILKKIIKLAIGFLPRIMFPAIPAAIV